MASHFRRPSRSTSRRGPKNNLWTTVLFNQTPIGAGAQNTSLIVTADDWIRAAGGNERCTLLRIRGMLSFAPEANTAVVASAMMSYVMVEDADVAVAASPFVAATYANEDILWTASAALPALAVDEPGPQSNWVIDIKAMRRIQKDQEIKIVTANTAGSRTQEVSGVLRALLRLGGN